MKKAVISFVVLLVGMGIVSTPVLMSLSSVASISGETKDSISKNKDNPAEETKEDPHKDKKVDITATIEIHPNKLNCKSKGRWITVYIELPSSYDVEEIDINSIVLSTTIGSIGTSEDYPHAIVDINENDVPELMIKFDRTGVIEILEHQQFCEITVIGNLYDSVKFKGSYTIELIHFS
jgi:hypothetical protein